tara:strand:- start:230 stop:1291 length:1062 start_codon:yes stop_codon:yes gene_type:complete
MNSTIKKKIKSLSKVFRVRGPQKTRFSFLRLDKNEKTNKFKPYFFKKILNKLKSEHLTAYPEVENLYSLISKKDKVGRDSIVLTAGSDGVIRACFDFFVEKGSKIITIEPTFAMVNIYAKIFQTKQIKIGYNKNLEIDFLKLIKSIKKGVELIIIANPNSPTGTKLNKYQIKTVLDKAKKNNVPILIDEAYYGFCKTTCVPFLKKYKNLIISRTFSKAFGVAGARVGYLIANPLIAKTIFKLKPMYEINSIGVVVSEELIKNRLDRDYVKEVEKGRNLLKKYLISENYQFILTDANFMHINFGQKVNKVKRIFIKKNILIKGGPQVKGFEKYLRVTLGSINEMKEVIKVLKKI